MNTKKIYYYPLFDFLKFLASVALICYHFELFTHFYYEGHISFAFGSFDTQRVTGIFLLISGFLALQSLNKLQEDLLAKDKWLYFGTKIKKEILRFLPLLYITMLIILSIGLPFYHKTGGWLWGYPLTMKGILSSFLLSSQCGLCYNFWSINGVSWYINALLRALIVLYLLQFLPAKIRPFLYGFFCILGYTMYFVSSETVLVPWFGGWSGKAFGGFYLGTLFYLLLRKMNRDLKLLLGVLLLVFYAFLVNFTKLPCDFILYTDFALFGGILVLATMVMNRKIKFIEFLGKLSFSMFLWHVPLLFVYGILVQNQIITNEAPFYARYILVIITILVSIFSHYFIEKPFNKLLKIN